MSLAPKILRSIFIPQCFTNSNLSILVLGYVCNTVCNTDVHSSMKVARIFLTWNDVCYQINIGRNFADSLL